MTAYSMMALKMLKMHVTMKLSIALRLLDEEDGAFTLKVEHKLYTLFKLSVYLTALKVFMMTRKRITNRDILPGTTYQ